MARLKKEDHTRILHMVDVERRAVREIAAEFGCTAANIYSLLAKLRRGGREATADAETAMQPADPTPPNIASAQSAFGLGEETLMAVDELPLVVLPEVASKKPAAPQQPAAPEKPIAAKLAVVPASQPGAPQPAKPRLAAPPALGARLSKPGMGLVMRTEDGEETMTPFRSIDDLLSAIKPILRASARSQDPVWFSLQPVDLSMIEVDAA